MKEGEIRRTGKEKSEEKEVWGGGGGGGGQRGSKESKGVNRVLVVHVVGSMIREVDKD